MQCKTAAQLWASALAAKERCGAVRHSLSDRLDALTELQQAAQKLAQHERTCPVCATPTAARFDGQVMGG